MDGQFFDFYVPLTTQGHLRTRKAVEMYHFTSGRERLCRDDSPQDEKGCGDEDNGKEVTSGRERLWR